MTEIEKLIKRIENYRDGHCVVQMDAVLSEGGSPTLYRNRIDTCNQIIAALHRTAEDDKAREEGRFAPGSSVYVVERDECGEAAEVTGYMFLAVSGQWAILSSFINDMERLEDTIGEHIVETAENMSTDLYVYPIEDVFFTRQEAEAALDGGGE